MEIFLAVLAPVLGLTGTALGLWLGERRWKRDSQRKEAEGFQVNLRQAYFGLWDIVEDAHLKMRAALEGLTAEVFSGFLADVNNFMIKHGLYITRDDRILVLEYLFWTNEYLRVLAQSPRGRALVEMSMAYTTREDGGLGMQVQVLEELQDRAQELRNLLRSRIREVVGAPPSDAWSSGHQPSAELLEKLDSLVSAVEKRQEDAAAREVKGWGPIASTEVHGIQGWADF